MKFNFKKIPFLDLTYIILISLLMVTVHTLTLPHGVDQYGYDYGFYSYAIKHTPLDSPAYFLGQVNDYGNHLFMILNWLRLPQVPSLETSYLLFSILSAILLFYYLKKYSLLSATFGVGLFIFSIAQTQNYSMFLWKSSYGQLLMLTTFLLLEYRKQILSFIPLILIYITHKTTTIVVTVALAIHFLFENKKTRYWFLIAVGLLTIIFLTKLNGLSYITKLSESNVKDGIFLPISKYLIYCWYLIPLSIYGIYKSIKTKKEIYWLGLIGISLVIIITQTIFHQRMILFLDLGLIFFSSLSLHYAKISNVQKYIIAIAILTVSIFNLYNFSKEIQPQISEESIHEIHKFSSNNQGDFVLSLSAQDGPWLLANLSGNIRLSAPGLFEDDKSLVQWQTYWLNPKNEQFLNQYPQPLFLYHSSSVILKEPWDCLEQISKHFYKYTCYKKPS